MHRPIKRRVGRVRALVLASALLVSVFATAIPASAAAGADRIALPTPVVDISDLKGADSWVWTRSWVWTSSVEQAPTESSDDLVTTMSWVWTR